MTYRNSKQRCLKPFIKIENTRFKWKILIVDLRPKKEDFRGNQIMKVCSHVAERRDKNVCFHCENTGNKNNAPEINNRRSILAMRCIGQRFRVIKNLCAVMSLPNPVEQKSHDVINNKLSRVMKEVAEESMKMAAVEEYSSSP
ncbi:hypothetical protein TNCV_2272771 [Trichonephila clavipes]|nr:hypothetical protein TNCV_2272771 [Trichonephila clavipes]